MRPLNNYSSSSLDGIASVGLWCVGAYSLSLILDGVLRWLLDGAGMAALLYLRELLPPLAMAVAWRVAAREGFVVPRRLLICVFVFLSVWLVWALAQSVPPMQALFGCKTLLSIPAGIALWVLLKGRESSLPIFCLAAGALALAGVIIDHFRDFPWAGLVYELGDLQIEGQREWTIDKVARLAGFSRASFDVASQMAVMATLVLVSGLSRFVRWPFVALLAAGIILTTSRSTLLGMLAALACWSFLNVTRLSILRLVLLPVVWLPAGVVVLVFGLPGVTSAVASLDREGAASTLSFALRTEGNWLDALAMVSDAKDWAMGLGVGGIGAAQKPFDPGGYVAPDNLFIYTLVSFGIVGSFLVFAGLTRAWLAALIRPCSVSYCILLPLVGVSGMTISGVESPFIGMGLGLAIADGFARCTAEQKAV